MSITVIVALLIALASTLYAMAGQAGGTAFLAVMAFTFFPPDQMRPTSLALNVAAAGYATWRLHRERAIAWPLLRDLALPSLPAALVGGFVVLPGRAYLVLTGVLLLLAAGLMLVRSGADEAANKPVPRGPMMLAGAGTGFVSGLTGVGGGVFLAPLLIFTGWASPKRAAGLSAPFILANSAVALLAVLTTGQSVAPGFLAYAAAALLGAMVGTAIGLRWLSQVATRHALALVLLVAGGRLLLT